MWDFAGETSTRLTLGDGGVTYPAWTPDGERIAYTGGSTVSWKASNNTGVPEPLIELSDDMGQVRPYSFTSDGSALVARYQQTADSGDDLVMLALDADSVVWRLNGNYNERNAALSPDGRWMAYQSDETGQFQIYARPFPGVQDDLVAISNSGGFDPVWSRSGEELFYLQPGPSGPQLVAVSVDTSDPAGAFTLRAREVVMEWPYVTVAAGRNYDVSLDGTRFVAIKQGQGAAGPTSMAYLVTDWFEELRALMGGS